MSTLSYLRGSKEYILLIPYTLTHWYLLLRLWTGRLSFIREISIAKDLITLTKTLWSSESIAY